MVFHILDFKRTESSTRASDGSSDTGTWPATFLREDARDILF